MERGLQCICDLCGLGILPNPPQTQKTAATGFCESLFVVIILSFGERCDKISVILWKGG